MIRNLYKIKQNEIKPSFIKIASVNLKVSKDLQCLSNINVHTDYHIYKWNIMISGICFKINEGGVRNCIGV